MSCMLMGLYCDWSTRERCVLGIWNPFLKARAVVSKLVGRLIRFESDVR